VDVDGWMDGYASKVCLLQNSLGTTQQEVEYQRYMKNIMNSLVSRGYTSGLINIDDLSVGSSTVASKKGDKK
jgi:hypothetical protein